MRLPSFPSPLNLLARSSGAVCGPYTSGIAARRHPQLSAVASSSVTSSSPLSGSSASCLLASTDVSANCLVSRNFSSTAASLQSIKAPSFRNVPFAKEDMAVVMQEVPELKFYYTGEELGKDNPYSSIPLNQSILSSSSSSLFPHFTPTKPQLQFSRLENGLKIASVDKGGLTASLGLFVNAGSRFESIENYGVSHMIENISFHSTAHLSWLRTIKTIEALGGSAGCSVGREHIVYSAECLRSAVPVMVPILTGNVLFPRLLPWELKNVKERLLMTRDRLERSPDALVTELLHTTAWHSNTLGNKLFGTARSLQYYNADTIRQFMLDHFSPENMIFVAVNVDHDEICKWLMRSFVDYNSERKGILCENRGGMGGPARKESRSGEGMGRGAEAISKWMGEVGRDLEGDCRGAVRIDGSVGKSGLTFYYASIPHTDRKVNPPVYTGGDTRHEGGSPLAHLAIAFETPGGWNSADLVPLTVLQNLMGGGGSFSTGGPGKGMYTRLFLNVLNNHEWIDSCMAFNSQYSDSGLFGIYMTASPLEGRNMINVIADEIQKMGNVQKDELSRAKNSLKSSIFMNLENRQIVMEDVARQLLMSGRVVTGGAFCDAVDAVTEADIKRVVTKMVNTPPTVVAHGDVSTIPHHAQIVSAIKGGGK